MTVDLVRRFGIRISHDEGLTQFGIEGGQSYRPSAYTVEGDWSGAAFLLVAGAIAGKAVVTGLDLHSLQADRAVLAALEAAGADLTVEEEGVSVEGRDLRAFIFDAADCPDLFPPLAALAAHCEGTSVIYGAERLVHKESDRAGALKEEFGRMGILIETCGNRMEVHGGVVQPTKVHAHNDHRIAMACAVAALRSQGEIAIEGSECVAKSYPGFFSDLERLKGLA
jgi:3-phosphoshikimate 1-carboxyvinyltransferase